MMNLSWEKGDKIYAQVMMDEMKLKSGIYFNSSSLEVTGFSSDGGGIDLDGSIKKILKEKSGKKQKDSITNADENIASHVNQWRLRTVYNEVMNLEFFYTSGDADGSELLRQFLHVLTCLSLIDIKVTGVLFDAGGNNRRFARMLLSGGTNIVNGAPERVSFQNMFDNNGELIFVFYCSTHNLKSCRNQLLASSGTSKSPRMFHDSRNIYFGWNDIKNQWSRELERLNKGSIPMTDLSMSAVFPDTWNKMRVTHAKAVFTERTLSDELAFLSVMINCANEVTNAVITDQELELGMCLQTKQTDILLNKSQEVPNINPSVQSAISCLQFRVYSSALYIQLFLNKDVQLNRKNIKRIRKRIEYILKWFTEWFNQRDIRKQDLNQEIRTNWEKSVMSIITFQVMHLGEFGFLGYAEYILDNCPDVYYVPVLHSNTSSLEAHFSLMRWYGADTASKYSFSVNIVDNQKSMSRLKANGMYDPHEERFVKKISLTGNRSEEKDKIILECQKIRESELSIHVFDFWLDESKFIKCADTWNELKKSLVRGSYKNHLLQNTDLKEYLKAGLMTEQGKCIKYFLLSTDIEEELLFNRVCQQLMTNIFFAMVNAVQNATTKLESSFWYNLFQFLSSDIFTHILMSLPPKMRNRKFLASIHLCLTQIFTELMHESAVKDNSTEAVSGYSTMHTTSEIHRFVGWSVKSRKGVVEKALVARRTTTKKSVNLLRSFLDEKYILNLIGTSEEKVKDDVEFMENYYPVVDKIYNRGGLTLISKNFMKWAQVLVTAINLHINETKIQQVKDDVMNNARKMILNNATIFKCFINSFEEVTHIKNDVYVRCHKGIVMKCMKARAKTVFKFFNENYLGHYSKRLNVEFRKSLQVSAKNKRHKIEPKVEKIGE